jgi:hypothetical protein
MKTNTDPQAVQIDLLLRLDALLREAEAVRSLRDRLLDLARDRLRLQPDRPAPRQGDHDAD